MTETLTYQERARAMTGKARAALAKSISVDWGKAMEMAKDAGKLEVSAINLIRAIGLKAQEVSGKEQADFASFQDLQSLLPKQLTFAAWKKCIHVSKKLKEPAKTLDEARYVQRDLFGISGDMVPVKRLAAQTAHDDNPWPEFTSRACNLVSFFSRLEEDPMDKWDSERLDTFVENTKPIVEKHQQALKLLGS